MVPVDGRCWIQALIREGGIFTAPLKVVVLKLFLKPKII